MIKIWFTDVSARIASIIESDAALTAYCVDNLGFALNIINNTVVKDEFKGPYPTCHINRIDGDVYKNRGIAKAQASNDWGVGISFFADFSEEQGNNQDFTLPSGVKVVAGNITTYTPADIMMNINEMVGELIDKEIGCGSKTEGVFLEKYNIMTELYYSENSGVIGSKVEVELYKLKEIY